MDVDFCSGFQRVGESIFLLGVFKVFAKTSAPFLHQNLARVCVVEPQSGRLPYMAMLVLWCGLAAL